MKCPYCGQPPKMVTGEEIYPRLEHLHYKNFWSCPPCGAYVGCHDPNPRLKLNGTEPLGTLANAELRKARSAVHAAFDPLWKRKRMNRTQAYQWLGQRMGLPPDQTHVACFNLVQCKLALNTINQYQEKKIEYAL